MATPLVTIRCLVYNHEPYLRQCLDGFVMQKTNFPFEAIVHDDASTDRSAEIIREYAEKYPDIIKPIFETENQYSKRDGSIRRIMNENTRGKYVAMCEGDDYWIDPLKLQKQIDFLETNSEYSMCFHNAQMHYENCEKKDKLFSNIKNRDYTGVEIYANWIVPTASVVFNSSILFSDRYADVMSNDNFVFRDTILFLICSEAGKIRGFSDVMSVYRRHNGGITHNVTLSRITRFINHHLEISKVFGNKYIQASENKCVESYCQTFYKSLKNGILNISILKKSFKLSYIRTVKCLIFQLCLFLKHKNK